MDAEGIEYYGMHLCFCHDLFTFEVEIKFPRSTELLAFHNPGHKVWSHSSIVHYHRMVIIYQCGRDGALIFDLMYLRGRVH